MSSWHVSWWLQELHFIFTHYLFVHVDAWYVWYPFIKFCSLFYLFYLVYIFFFTLDLNKFLVFKWRNIEHQIGKMVYFYIYLICFCWVLWSKIRIFSYTQKNCRLIIILPGFGGFFLHFLLLKDVNNLYSR